MHGPGGVHLFLRKDDELRGFLQGLPSTHLKAKPWKRGHVQKKDEFALGRRRKRWRCGAWLVAAGAPLVAPHLLMDW